MTAEEKRTAQADLQSSLRNARRELAEARDEIAALREIIAGGDHARWGAARLVGKTARQRAALDILNRRVTTQRFQLRLINELGRGLSAEEFKAARDALPEAQRERVGQPS